VTIRPRDTLSPDDLVEIGIVARPWGVRGEVKVRPTSDIPDRFARLAGVWLFDGRDEIRYHALTGTRRLNDAVVLALEGVDSREAAEALRNWTVSVPEGERAPLNEDEYYIDNLIGLEVWGRTGESLGRLTRVFQGAAQDVFEITTADGPVLVPAVAAWIDTIDLDAGRMVVELPIVEEVRPGEETALEESVDEGP